MNLVGSVDFLKCQFNVILLLQRRLLLIHLQFLKCDFLILFSCIGGVNLSCLILELPSSFPLLNFAILFSDFICQLFSVLSCPVLAVPSSFVSSSNLINLLSSLSIWAIKENIEMTLKQLTVFLHIGISFVSPFDDIQPADKPVSCMA